MMIFITGGSGSGKSEYAEKRAVELGNDPVYIATMPVFSEEDKKKVERHHKLRKGKGFDTLERPGRLTDIPSGPDTILLECMSTHVANILFGDDELGRVNDEDIIFFIRSEIDSLINRTGDTVIVSAEVAMDGCIYDEETEKYIRILTKINSYLADIADEVFEVVAGIPVMIKGGVNA